MRLHIETTPSDRTVPFNYQYKLTGVIHKWIGENNIEHGKLSLYSFAMLKGGKVNSKESGLEFENGATFFISAYHDDLLKEMIFNIQQEPKMFCGLNVREVIIQETPDLSNTKYFQVASPVLIKRSVGQKINHFTFNDKEAPALLKETLLNKMKLAGLTDDTLEISFDQNYQKAKTTLIHYNGIKNKANVCPVIIKGKPETKAFAWNVGIGNSTGIGFGAIK